MLNFLQVSLLITIMAILSVLAMFVVIDRSFTIYHLVEIWFGKFMMKVTRVKLTVSGKENLDPKKSYVYVCNHCSIYDIPVMKAILPTQTYMVHKVELGRIPFFGWQMLIGPYIGVDRKNFEKARKSIDKAKRVMEKKKVSMLLFPEGTRSADGKVLPFKRGAFFLAARVNHPIVPVSISGTHKILPKKTFKLSKGNIHIHFAEPIDTKDINTSKEEKELMNRVRDIIIENKREV